MYLITWVCVHLDMRETVFFTQLCMNVFEGKMFVFVLEPNPAFINTDYYPGSFTVFPL